MEKPGSGHALPLYLLFQIQSYFANLQETCHKKVDNKNVLFYCSKQYTLMRCIMNVVRVNMSLPKETYQELTEEVESRGRSRFISEAIRNALTKRRNLRLAVEYREAGQEIKRINTDLEGTIADGID
jgi:Arc/MetJ-type ribon-helix-helix transcriptional regulator